MDTSLQKKSGRIFGTPHISYSGFKTAPASQESPLPESRDELARLLGPLGQPPTTL
jgi:hypothetical protein